MDDLGLDGPERLERPGPITTVGAVGVLPAGQAQRETLALKDKRPLAVKRVLARAGHLGRPIRRRAEILEIRKHHRQLGSPLQLAPATLGLAIEAFALKGPE